MQKISRAKLENGIYLALNVTNMIVFLLVFVAAVVKAVDGTLGEIVQAMYCTTFSVLLIINEVEPPASARIYFGFLGVHRGKGLFILFLGCAVMCDKAFNIIVSIFSFTLGLAYTILSFVPDVPPPNAFWFHWQHHKDFWSEGLDLKQPSPAYSVSATCIHPSAWRPHKQGAIDILHGVPDIIVPRPTPCQ